MKYINELIDGEKVESVFAVTEKQLRTTRAGKTFISMKLWDKTGAIDAVVWDNADATSQKFEKSDYVGIRAEVSTYNGTKQLTIQQLKKIEKTADYLPRFMPTTEKDPAVMEAEVRAIVASFNSSGIRSVIEGFLNDEAFMAKFRVSPAAKGMHHVFSGGLMQHTLKVMRICSLLYDEYRANDPAVSSLLNRDILIAGAFLHDIGKVDEISPEPGFEYTTRGRLLGHVSLGLLELKKKLDEAEGVSGEESDLLMHLVLSHHGELEYGSPKRPKSLEAFILHYADNIDAKLQGLYEFIAKDTAGGKMTAYNKAYERFFYRGLPEMEEGGEDSLP